jgi:hypothetical protein
MFGLMAYSDIALLASDVDFYQRVSACVADETNESPTTWVQQNIWPVAASPGFGDAYASALAGGVQRPGNDQSVISDPQILSAVQSLLTDS